MSGFLRSSVEDMAAAAGEAERLSPRQCRAHVAASFSAKVMVAGYERVVEEAMATAPAGRSGS